MATRSTTRAQRGAKRTRPAGRGAAAPSRNGADRSEAVRAFERGYPRDREREDLYPFTISGLPIKPLYGPGDLAGIDYGRDIGVPGEYPYTRGVHATGYRGKTWTMRMFAGFGTAEETNARFKYLLSQGQTGLSIAFDLATLMGYDTDQPQALGEFGKCG